MCKPIALSLLLSLLLVSCDSPTLPYREKDFTTTFPISFYVVNGSETQPATDLRIEWDTVLVAQDTFRYTNTSDLFDVYNLASRRGPHRIKVTNAQNALVEDTTIVVDTTTHVFISFLCKKLDSTMIQRIRSRNPPEGEAAVIEALSEPKRLVIHIEEGPISIP